jgi:hypothetical protein
MRSIGASRLSPVAAIFTNADGAPCKMPCLFGITPDDTDPDIVQAKFEAHPLTRTLTFLDTSGSGVGINFELLGKTSDGREIAVIVSIQHGQNIFIEITTNPVDIFDVEYDITSPLIPLLFLLKSGDFISYLGSPTLLVFGKPNAYGLSYANQHFQIDFSLLDFSSQEAYAAFLTGRTFPRVNHKQGLDSIYFATDAALESFPQAHYPWQGFREYDPQAP